MRIIAKIILSTALLTKVFSQEKPFDLSSHYQITRNYCTHEAFTESLVSLTDALIKTHYTQENLEKHIAYISDKKPNRSSFAFVVYSSSDQSNRDLQGLDFSSLPPELQALQLNIEQKLGITQGRLLFNIQRYWDNSTFLPTHFDGELIQFIKNDDDTLEIKKAIRPKKTAILTLINHTIGGGTQLISPDTKQTMVAYNGPGDLLIIDNSEILHGAESFQKKEGASIGKNGYVRYTIGWRSLDDCCEFFQQGQPQLELSYEEALNIHKKYMMDVWPLRFHEIQLNGEAAF